MPIRDWTRAEAGIFHDFHHEWISTINRALNEAFSGSEYYSLAEQIRSTRAGVLTLQASSKRTALATKEKVAKPKRTSLNRVLALERAPPVSQFRITNPRKWYAGKKKSVTIRHVSEHRVVAALEIMSPGNKDSKTGITAFVRKTQDLLGAGVHLSLVDLFPPTPRDPEGIHPVVWGEDDGDTFRFNPRKPLTCAAYIGGLGAQAFVTPVAVGDRLPNLPVFLTPEQYVPVPLEQTYQEAFDAVPEIWREALIAKR